MSPQEIQYILNVVSNGLRERVANHVLLNHTEQALKRVADRITRDRATVRGIDAERVDDPRLLAP